MIFLVSSCSQGALNNIMLATFVIYGISQVLWRMLCLTNFLNQFRKGSSSYCGLSSRSAYPGAGEARGGNPSESRTLMGIGLVTIG